MDQRTQLQALRIGSEDQHWQKPDHGSRMPICFFCHKEVESELLVLVNNTLEEMVCICSKHLGEHSGKNKRD